ncbi:MAG: hypothetical protein EOO80_02155 [Oxalobacteraceae bacterium]|nr:MAG: hypothetical protein EOO80_02155 [Oxalobacteraceae bacterium]
MSFADTLFGAPLTAVPFAHLLTSMVQLTVLGAVLMFFRPLLIGIARALVLVVRPRPTKDQLAARRKLNTAKQADLELDTPIVRVMGSRS